MKPEQQAAAMPFEARFKLTNVGTPTSFHLGCIRASFEAHLRTGSYSEPRINRA
jgi:hypothetical protein